VADRVNGRIQVFDQNGKWLTEYRQFNHPSGLFITKDDTLYATDYNSEGQKGTYIGSAKTGKVTAFVPDAEAGEGIALAPNGMLYAATPTGVTRFFPKKAQ
jgi:DNA-binding beta-propeller fold protein YncE